MESFRQNLTVHSFVSFIDYNAIPLFLKNSSEHFDVREKHEQMEEE